MVYAATPGVWEYDVAGEDFAHVAFTLMARFWGIDFNLVPLEFRVVVAAYATRSRQRAATPHARKTCSLRRADVIIGKGGERWNAEAEAGGGCRMFGERRWDRRVWWRREIYG